MFKRSVWDPAFAKQFKRFYMEVVYQDRPGWTKADHALRNAAWNLEWGYARGNAGSNQGLYDWEAINPKAERFLKQGGRVDGSPDELTRLVKAAALHLGAGLVGVAKVHPNWIYSHEFNPVERTHRPFDLPDDCRTAVVMAIPMDYKTIRSKSMVLQGVTTGMGYSQMALTANLLAAFIRGLGYKALPAGNDSALSVPLALAAGLGEWSRMGLLVTERFGPRVRLCKVFTDMDLAPDLYRPFGVVDFCRVCMLCAESCPSQAIPQGEPARKGPNVSSQSGVLKWYVNGERCFTYWATRRMDCTRCLSICPFNKPPGLLHDLVRFSIRRLPRLNRLMLWGDKLLGYQKRLPVEDFWRWRD
ncbi:MAG: reductive dehalogenase [Chlorobiales bacterium]|nr:reductive dehalogenase [Chlorobiales bacterium]